MRRFRPEGHMRRYRRRNKGISGSSRMQCYPTSTNRKWRPISVGSRNTCKKLPGPQETWENSSPWREGGTRRSGESKIRKYRSPSSARRPGFASSSFMCSSGWTVSPKCTTPACTSSGAFTASGPRPIRYPTSSASAMRTRPHSGHGGGQNHGGLSSPAAGEKIANCCSTAIP